MANVDPDLTWQDAVDKIKKYVVRISTPDGHGTGFLLSRSTGKRDVFTIATAAHVIAHAHEWRLPMKIFHPESDKTVMLSADQRTAVCEPANDTGVVFTFHLNEIPFPLEALPLASGRLYLRVGIEIGWLGFPALLPKVLSFFSGRISSYVSDEGKYYVDGVAINGVSGGPAFVLHTNGTFSLLGFVSAYLYNRPWTGETLPGMSVVRHLGPLRALVKSIKDIEKAREGAAALLKGTVMPSQPQAPNPPASPASPMAPDGKKGTKP